MPLFWIERTRTLRTLVKAPTKAAAATYAAAEDTTDHEVSSERVEIREAPTQAKHYGGVPPVPDVYVDETGAEIDDPEDG